MSIISNNTLYERAFAAVQAQRGSRLGAPPWAGRKIVIYGAGGFGQALAKVLLQKGASVLGFLDQKGNGQEAVPGLRAFRLDSPEAKTWLAEKPVAIIGVFNCLVSFREVKEALTVKGFSTVLTPMEIYPHLREELGWRYWLGRSQDYTEAVAPLKQVFELWADEESKRLFLETILFRLESDLTALSVTSGADNQYADATVGRWKEPLRIVDGGAYVGDSIQGLAAHKYTFDSIYAFEPDAANFKQLKANASTFAGGAKASLWPCGLWSSSCSLRFAGGSGAASGLSDAGAVHVPVVALDDVLIHQPVNFIKLDVEGAEPEALQGARGIIARDLPVLAVCLYHYPHHLWSIPLWVESLKLGYRLYFRAHHYNSFEIVLYAVPK
jgi:FkbM family methyltransferase